MADRLLVKGVYPVVAYIKDPVLKVLPKGIQFAYVPAVPCVIAPGGSAVSDITTGITTLTANINTVGSTSTFKRGFLLSRTRTPKLFSEQDVNNANFDDDFAVTGDAGWAVVNGLYQSGAITSSQRAEVTLPIKGPGTIHFNYKTSTEVSDRFYAYLDGVAIVNGAYGVATAFSACDAIVPEGNHTLVFRYIKDTSISGGNDCVYLTNLLITGTDGLYNDIKVEETVADPQVGDFTLTVEDGLLPNTLYNVRPFVVNDAGVVYGDIIQLNTGAIPTDGWGGKIGIVDNSKMQAVAVGGVRIAKEQIQGVGVGVKVI